MFDLRDIDQRTDAEPDSTWRRFETILAADRRGQAPVATVAPPPTPIASRARAFRAGFLGGATGVALTLAALAAIGLRPPPPPADPSAPAPAAAAPALPKASNATGPARPADARATPPHRAEAPAPPLFEASRSLGAVAAIANAAAPATPPSPEARPTTRPASEAPWVVVHVAGENERARRVADALRAAGFATVRIRTVPAGVARPDLRYFRDADHAAARAAADAVEAALPRAALRDFTHYRPTPDAGLIEIWLD